MTLVAHLTELRNRIAKALLALLVATAVAFWWYEHGLGDFIRAPYCDLPAGLRLPQGSEQEGGLLITDVLGGGVFPAYGSLLGRAGVLGPGWALHPWGVITPGGGE